MQIAMFTILYVAMIVLGLATNVYLACVIWKSGTLGKKMKNKILMSMCILHIIQTTVCIPLRIVNYLNPVHNQKPGIDLLSLVHLHLERIPSMVDSMSLLALMITYLCNISNCQCVVDYSSFDRRFLAGLCVALPWIFSLYAVPSIIRHFEIPTNSNLTKPDPIMTEPDSRFIEPDDKLTLPDAKFWLNRLELVTLLICATLLCASVQMRRSEIRMLGGLREHHPFHAALRREIDITTPYATLIAVSIVHVLAWLICIYLRFDTFSTHR